MGERGIWKKYDIYFFWIFVFNLVEVVGVKFMRVLIFSTRYWKESCFRDWLLIFIILTALFI